MDWTTIEADHSGIHTPVDNDAGSYLRVTTSYTDGEGTGKTTRAVSLNPVHELEDNHASTFRPTETGIRTVPENTSPGTEIGEPFTAVDDHDHVLTYSLEGADADSFEIDTTTGQLFTKAPLDYEQKKLYSVVVTVHDGENAHGGPNHSNDATLAAIITVTNVDEGAPPSVCVDGGAVANSEDSVGMIADCETLLDVRDDLAGEALLNWSADVQIADWDGIAVGGSPERVTALDLGGRSLAGMIPIRLGLVPGWRCWTSATIC